MKKFKFSVIIPVYNVEDYLAETIDSVISQTIGFEDSIQIILVNDGSPDNSEEVCLKYKEKYPDNIVYVKQENSGVCVARNVGISKATGEFSTMLDSDDLWSKDSFEAVYNAYKKHPDINIYSCKMVFFDQKTGDHPLNFKYKKNKVVNILEDYEYIQLSSSSIFVKTDIIKKYKYEKGIKYSEDNRFINEIIFDELKMMMLKKPVYYYRKRQTGNSANQTSLTNPDWYLVTPVKVYKYLFNLSKEKFGHVIEYVQSLISYELSWRVKYFGGDSLTESQKKEYAKTLDELLEVVSDDIISANKFLEFSSIAYLLNKKNHTEKYNKLTFDDKNISIGSANILRRKLGLLIIDQTYIRNNKLICYGKLDTKFVPKKEFNIRVNNERINYEFYELTNDLDTIAYDGKKTTNYEGIKFEVDLNSNWKLGFYINDDYLMPRFKKNCILSESLSRSYHHNGKKTFLKKNEYIYYQNRNLFKSINYELMNDCNLIKRKKFKNLLARLYIKVGRLFKRKKIWLISDRVNKADDNGEHFFKYMINNHQEEKLYFVLSKKSVDYERMSKIGKVLDPNSTKYKLLFGLADYVVSSQGENFVFNPLGQSGAVVRDQYDFKFIFLQHGIIYNNLSPWLNVNTKKIDMFVTSAQREYDSILEYKYYFGKDVVRLTGLPRFDTLIEKSKSIKVENKIMLSFTWRTNLAAEINKETGQREYNPLFKESEYFKFLNNLMNDERLLKVLEKHNYKIRFIPHPNVLVQMGDFELNDYVEVSDENIDYQKEFCQNKILVTDYSSIYNDFCYLKKPVLFYQKDFEEFYEGQLYEKGYLDGEKDSFGPILKDYDKFVEALIKTIESDGKLEKKYETRIDKFFKFFDTNNCKRVYDEIIKLPK